MEQPSKFTAASRYKSLEQLRQGPLDRARKNSRLTLPWIMPPEGSDEQTELFDPFQNTGSQGVNHLSSKMTLAVMPPNEPFFRHDADDFAAAELEAEKPAEIVEAQQKLAKYDRAVMKRIEASGDRPKFDLLNKHLLIAGNALVDIRDDVTRVFGLDSYVVARDPRGRVIELVVKEQVHPDALPQKVRDQIAEETSQKGEPSGDKELLDLYTHSQLVAGFYEGFQEVDGVRVEGSEFKKKPTEFGFIALRFAVVDGQSYGRSFVESIIGDLTSLEVLTQAITDVASAASKVIFLVRQNGTTRVRDLQSAANFDFVSGDTNDVSVLRLDKGADLRIARELAVTIEERLGEQFLLRSAVTRQAERVTAEEIRYVALELEDALSGIYSLLTHELQLPYVRLKIKQMKDLPNLPEDVVNLTITTGLDALRRGHEMQKLRSWAEGLIAIYGPQVVAQFIPIEIYSKRLGDSLGLDLLGLIKPREEVEEGVVSDKITDAAIGASPSIIQGAIQNGQSTNQ